jgi:hypothetical protein
MLQSLKEFHLNGQDKKILKFYQIFHNYIKEHEALRRQTPAEKC